MTANLKEVLREISVTLWRGDGEQEMRQVLLPILL